MCGFRRDTRGSQTPLGHALLLGFIVLSIAAIMSSGAVSIDTLQYQQQTAGAEQSMAVLEGAVDDVVNGRAQRQTVPIKLSDSQLGVKSGGTISVTVNDTESSWNTTVGPDSSDEIAYTVRKNTGGEKTYSVTYEHGAVFKETPAGVAMADSPGFRFATDRTILSLVDVRASGGIGGSTTASVRVASASNDVEVLRHGSNRQYTVTVTVTDVSRQQAEAWERYFIKQGLTPTTQNDVVNGTVSYQFATSSVAVQRSSIRVQIR